MRRTVFAVSLVLALAAGCKEVHPPTEAEPLPPEEAAEVPEPVVVVPPEEEPAKTPGEGDELPGMPTEGDFPKVPGKPAIPEDAKAFEGHHYKAFDIDVSWHEAKKRCEAMGGHLATIGSEAEQDFIAELADDRYLFLGATDEAKEGEWRWVDDTPWKFTAWMDGQPNDWGGDENYLATYDYGEWVDVAVEGDDYWMPTGFICEWDE